MAAVAFGIAWVVALWYFGLYRLRARWRLRTEAKDIARSTVLVAALSLSVLFVFKQQDVSRLFLLTLFTVQPLVTLAGRGILRLAFSELRRRGHNTRYMLVVGTGRLAQDFADLVGGAPGPGDQRDRARVGPRRGRPPRHPADPGHARRHRADLPRQRRRRGRGLPAAGSWPATWSRSPAWPPTRARRSGSRSTRTTARCSTPARRSSRASSSGRWSTTGSARRALVVKRLIDIVGAAVGLVVLSPLLLGTALAIRLRDGSPVLFRQTRVGLHGRPFTILKFRTMAPDAEERLHEVAHLNERERRGLQGQRRPAHQPRWGGRCAGRASTSCRSCGTC